MPSVCARFKRGSSVHNIDYNTTCATTSTTITFALTYSGVSVLEFVSCLLYDDLDAERLELVVLAAPYQVTPELHHVTFQVFSSS